MTFDALTCKRITIVPFTRDNLHDMDNDIPSMGLCMLHLVLKCVLIFLTVVVFQSALARWSWQTCIMQHHASQVKQTDIIYF